MEDEQFQLLTVVLFKSTASGVGPFKFNSVRNAEDAENAEENSRVTFESGH